MNQHGFLRKKEVLLSLLLQLLISPLVGHGYDLRVSYMAGRNIVSGTSPYEGGYLPPDLSIGYSQLVQGLGETPLWAMYLGLSYALSSGNFYLFNFVTKLPIIGGNLVLAYLFYLRRNPSWMFFLFNPFLLATSTAWGKPDNLATFFALLSLVTLETPVYSGTFLAASLMIKPIALPLAAVFLGYFARLGTTKLSKFLLSLSLLSTSIFIVPFISLGWPTKTVTAGAFNWFYLAGGLSPFNILEYTHGTQVLPKEMLWAGFLSPASLILSIFYSLIKPPGDTESAARYSLAATSLFLATRPWLSEQNLVIIIGLFIMAAGRMPSRWLWLTPLIFSIANNGLQQLTYPLYPNIVLDLYELDRVTNNIRLLFKFAIVAPWLYILFYSVLKIMTSPKTLQPFKAR